MPDEIISLDTIARQASAAAAGWERGTPPPVNPYDAHMQPAAHDEFNRRFWLALRRQDDADELEGAAA